MSACGCVCLFVSGFASTETGLCSEPGRPLRQYRVRGTMLLPLLALGTVFNCAVVGTKQAENSSHKPLLNYSSFSLPEEHIPYFLRNNRKVAELCRQDPLCPFKDALRVKHACWGHEKNCSPEHRMGYPVCSAVDSGWASSVSAAQELFWKQADFGYVRERRSELKTLCKPLNPGDSSLKCANHMRFCRVTNLYLDLRNARRGHERYKEDFLQRGEIGGRCRLKSKALAAKGQHKSPLQSW